MSFQHRMVAYIVATSAACWFAQTALAQDEAPLKGEAILGEEGCPGGLTSDDCILSLRIEGKAAQLLFDGMRDKAQREECTGGMEKGDGNGLFCNKGEDGTYQCFFGYHFKAKQFRGGAFSC